MKRLTLVSLVGLLTMLWLTLPAHAQENDPLKTFMCAKLTHSQKVLEGLVEEDYAKIDKNAQEMSLLSLAATWQVLNTPDYVEASRKFRGSVDKLSQMAKSKNLDQTTKAFNEVTTRCVECHKYIRSIRTASRD